MTAAALDHVLAFLVPLFLGGGDGDQASARDAALELIGSCGATTDRRLLLAAEMIAFSFAALDSLARSMANPEMAVSTRLRLRSNANALSRSAERSRRMLEREEPPDTAGDQPRAPGTPAPQWQAAGPQAPGSQAPEPPAPGTHAPQWQRQGALVPETLAPEWKALEAQAPKAAGSAIVRMVSGMVVDMSPCHGETPAAGGQPLSRRQRRLLMRQSERMHAVEERRVRRSYAVTGTAATCAERDIPPQHRTASAGSPRIGAAA